MHRDKWNQVGELVAMNIQGGEWPCVVFVNRIGIAINLASCIAGLINKEVPAVHEAVPLEERSNLAKRMRGRDKSLPVVVATSIWATGLDIPALAAVYNCGVKRAVISLLQQAGRGERIENEKAGFVLYDISFGDKDAVHRLDVYREAGYEIEGPSDCTGALLMQKALDSPSAPRAAGEDRAQPLVDEGAPGFAALFVAMACSTFSLPVWIIICLALALGTCMGPSGS